VGTCSAGRRVAVYKLLGRQVPPEHEGLRSVLDYARLARATTLA